MPSIFVYAPAATLTLAEIAPPAVEAWLRLEVDGDFDRCAWRLEVSTDGSKTWTPLPETDPLPVATGDGSDHLQARIVLTPERADARAVVKTAAAVWRPGPADLIPLEAGGLRLLCRRTDGSLNEILDAETGRRLGLPLPRPLFALGYRTTDGKERTLQPHDFAPAVVTEPADGATRRWRFAFAKEGEPLRVVVTLAAPETAGTPWQAHLTVTNVGDGTLLWSDFPRFSGLLPVSSALLPESLWHVSGKGIFPGNLSMGWGYLEQAGDSGRGWYLGCHTPGVAAVELVAQAAAPLAELGARHYAAAVPGAEIALSFAFAAGPADWHWAADIYGAWARDPLKPVTPPAWARMSDGWWSLGVDTEAGLLDRRSVTMFEDARWYGLPHLQLWVGSGDGQMCGRLSYLNPRLGTPEMSRADCRRIRDRGGHLGHYIQAREWGGAAFAESDRVGFTARSYFPDDVRIEDAAWSERFALQKGGECWIMCPAAPAWQDHIARDAGERVTLFGNDVAYIDQLGCTVMDCGNPDHGHGPDRFPSGSGYTRMAEKALATMRAADPDTVLAQEGMNAATGQHVWFHLISSSPNAEHGKQFLYTFPGAALLRGYSNGVFQWQNLPLRPYFRQLFLFHRFEVPTYDPYLREVILLRQRVNDWQYRGRCMDNIDLTLDSADTPPDQPLAAKWFLYRESGTEGILITFVNEGARTDVGLRLGLDRVPFPPTREGFVYTDDGTVARLPITRDDGALRLTLPARKVGAILVPGAVAPADALRTFVYQDYGGGADHLVLAAANISAAPLTATWELHADAGYTFARTHGQIDLPPFGVWRETLPMTALPEAMGDAEIAWSWDGGTRRARAVLSPPLRNGSFESDVNGDGSPDSWWNFNYQLIHVLSRYMSDAPLRDLVAFLDREVRHEGAASVRLQGPYEYAMTMNNPFGVKGEKGVFRRSISQRLRLKPATAYRFSVHARRADRAAQGSLSVAGKKVGFTEGAVENAWHELALDFTTPADPGDTVVTLANDSRSDLPVWFDTARLSERGDAP